jgi:hypothetical protein
MDGKLGFSYNNQMTPRCFTDSNDTIYIDVFRPSNDKSLDADTAYYECFVIKSSPNSFLYPLFTAYTSFAD